MNVREQLPKRRLTPTNSPTGKNWSEHKPDLQEDFHFHCGYCGSYDGYRHTYFEVDHFVPKSLFEKGTTITYCQYDNLVYSCKFCNNNKSSKWPSDNIAPCVIKNKGFIDPCDKKYDDHVYRTADGGILWKTDLGKYLVKEAFKFDERDYSIKILWELNQRRKLLDVLIEEMKKRKPTTKKYKEIEEQAKVLSLEYYTFDKALMEYYNSI